DERSLRVISFKNAHVKRSKATRGRVRTPKASRNKTGAPAEFRTKCFRSARRLRIAFICFQMPRVQAARPFDCAEGHAAAPAQHHQLISSSTMRGNAIAAGPR